MSPKRTCSAPSPCRVDSCATSSQPSTHLQMLQIAPKLVTHLSPTMHNRSSLSLISALLLVVSSPTHLSTPTAARLQVPTLRAISAPSVRQALPLRGAVGWPVHSDRSLSLTRTRSANSHPRERREQTPTVPAESSAAKADSRRAWRSKEQSARVMATRRPRWGCVAPERS